MTAGKLLGATAGNKTARRLCGGVAQLGKQGQNFGPGGGSDRLQRLAEQVGGGHALMDAPVQQALNFLKLWQQTLPE